MKLQKSLSAKILFTAFVNLALLITVFLIFARVQSRFDLSSFLLAPARDRIFSLSRLIALNLEETPRPFWDRVLQQYASKYETQFFLFDGRGKQYAGAMVALPAAVATAISHDLFFGAKASDPGPAPQPLGEGPLFLVPAGNPTSYWVGAHIPIWPVRPGPPRPAFLIWKFHSLWTNTFFFNYRAWAMVILAVISVSVVCWLPLIRDLTTAISELTHATGRVAEGHF